jgi:hypothetical protein
LRLISAIFIKVTCGLSGSLIYSDGNEAAGIALKFFKPYRFIVYMALMLRSAMHEIPISMAHYAPSRVRRITLTGKVLAAELGAIAELLCS